MFRGFGFRGCAFGSTGVFNGTLKAWKETLKIKGSGAAAKLAPYLPSST